MQCPLDVLLLCISEYGTNSMQSEKPIGQYVWCLHVRFGQSNVSGSLIWTCNNLQQPPKGHQ